MKSINRVIYLSRLVRCVKILFDNFYALGGMSLNGQAIPVGGITPAASFCEAKRRGYIKVLRACLWGCFPLFGILVFFLIYSYAMEQAKFSTDSGGGKISIPFGGTYDYSDILVLRAVDGDTLKLENGERVRLIGIDTPELHESNKLYRDSQRTGQDIRTIQALGRRAYEFTRNLVEAKRVKLEFDVERHDKYDRLLAYVYLKDGTFVNAEIVKQGYANLMSIPPNVKYADLFQKLYQEARENNRGLWQ